MKVYNSLFIYDIYYVLYDIMVNNIFYIYGICYFEYDIFFL